MPGATNHYSMGFEVRHTDVSSPTHQQLKKDKGTQITIDMELQDKRMDRRKTESEITVSE